MKSAKRMGLLAALVGAVGLLASACGSPLGERCEEDGACGEELVCSRPRVNGQPAAVGVCDYPLRAASEPCTVAAECASGLTCSNHFAPGERYGTCVPQRENGEACFAARDCASGRCKDASGTALDGTCAPK